MSTQYVNIKEDHLFHQPNKSEKSQPEKEQTNNQFIE